MKRKKIIAGNWKMNLSAGEAAKLATDIKANLSASSTCEAILFPSYLYLSEVNNILKDSTVKVGAQNCSDKESGAFTGEVSAMQLQSAGIEYVLIGHSERREYFKENHPLLKDKLSIALKHNLKPIFCCGEPLQIRERNSQKEYVMRQLDESLFGLSEKDLNSVTIAYEPVWAIGTGLNATAEQAQEMHAFIREQVKSKVSESLAQSIRILYGGSCKPENAGELFACTDVDGGLIGGASLKAKDFLTLIELAG
ncbi:MAG: triose-phosphate isomerase [Bacteroidetes bacterium]|nr:triose-phosphate isomerase [Bacteroidota bacterium]